MKKAFKKYWYFFIIGGILVIVLIFKMIERSRSKRQRETIKEVKVISFGGQNTPVENIDKTKLLSKPMTGAEVKYLQMLINIVAEAKGDDKISEDGIFGDITEEKVLLYTGKKSTTINTAISLMDSMIPYFSITSLLG